MVNEEKGVLEIQLNHPLIESNFRWVEAAAADDDNLQSREM
jgi:hypothetical protein